MANPIGPLWRDAKFGVRLLRVLRLFSDLKPDAPGTIADDFEAVVDADPDKIAFVFEGEEVTYRQYDERANRVARWGLSQGLKVGDAFALNLENCPDFAAIWFGLAKIGVATALINTNLEADGLAHCIGIVDAKAVIAGGEQAARVKVSLAKNGAKLPIWDLDGNHGQDGTGVGADQFGRPGL